MQSLHFSIIINAPRDHVYRTMIDDASYRQWTSVFSPGSYFEGGWNTGDQIKFLGPQGGGMGAEIAENRVNEFISIHHLYELGADNTPDLSKNNGEPFHDAYENYTFTDQEGETLVAIELMGLPDEYADMFNETWPKALEVLKQICEQ